MLEPSRNISFICTGFPFLKTTTLLLYSIYSMILIPGVPKGHVLKTWLAACDPTGRWWMFRCWDPGRGTCPRRDVGSRPSLLPRLLQQPYPLYTPAKVVPRWDPGGMTQVHISSSSDSPRYFVVVTESRNTSYFLAMFAAFSYRFIFHKQKQQQQKNGVRFTLSLQISFWISLWNPPFSVFWFI